MLKKVALVVAALVVVLLAYAASCFAARFGISSQPSIFRIVTFPLRSNPNSRSAVPRNSASVSGAIVFSSKRKTWSGEMLE